MVPSQPQVTATPQKSEVVTPAITSGIDLPDVAIPTAMASAAYVKHWIGNDAYTHNLLSHRYGITAAQLDGFLQSTGITYDSSRIDGQKILDREKSSGLDARAIIAIAIAESSLGTQGVATAPGANMFGFVAETNMDREQILFLLDSAHKYHIYFLFGGLASYLMTNISDVPKAIRTQAQYVLLGMRVMDQSVLPKSYNSKEPYLKPDMIYIHDRRQERMLKITQEIEMEH